MVLINLIKCGNEFDSTTQPNTMNGAETLKQ